MKKLSLNKQTIAQLDKITGGEEKATVASLAGGPQTCAELNLSCAGAKKCAGGATNFFMDDWSLNGCPTLS